MAAKVNYGTPIQAAIIKAMEVDGIRVNRDTGPKFTAAQKLSNALRFVEELKQKRLLLQQQLREKAANRKNSGRKPDPVVADRRKVEEQERLTKSKDVTLKANTRLMLVMEAFCSGDTVVEIGKRLNVTSQRVYDLIRKAAKVLTVHYQEEMVLRELGKCYEPSTSIEVGYNLMLRRRSIEEIKEDANVFLYFARKYYDENLRK